MLTKGAIHHKEITIANIHEPKVEAQFHKANTAHIKTQIDPQHNNCG
jgi:hypothetical protein